MHRDAGCLADGEMGYDNSSRMEPKRGQWFMDANGPQLLNKKQATESANGRPVSGVSHMNVATWDNTSGFQSVPAQCTDRLFGSEQMRTVNVVDRNIQSVGSGNMNMGRKGFENQYGSTPSVGLSMSHTMEDPSSCLNFGGIRKVKVNQVRDSDNVMTPSMGNSYSRLENSMSMGNSYNKSANNNISLGQSYNNGEESNISMASTFAKADESFISVDQTYNNKGDGNFRSMGQNYSNGDNSVLSMGQSYAKGDRNFISMGQLYEKGDGSGALSSGTSYNKRHEDFISISSAYGKSNDDFIPSYLKGNENMVSMGPTYKVDSSVVPMPTKGESTTISFGGFHDEPETNTPGSIISSYDLLISNQNSAQTLEVSEQKNPAESNVDTVVDSIIKADSKPDNMPKTKEPKIAKKAPPNNFPSNVKSLLSTGMFDGVPVKYVSWSRDVSSLQIFISYTNLIRCR